MKFYYSKEGKTFKGHCGDIALPIAFEYNPRANSVNEDGVKPFRRAFAQAFNPHAGKTVGPTVLVARGSFAVDCAMAEMIESTCASLGSIPVVLNGPDLKDTDTFWVRAAVAAKTMSVGSLPVVAVDRAHEADKDSLEAAVAASKEHRFALCFLSSVESRLPVQIPRSL